MEFMVSFRRKRRRYLADVVVTSASKTLVLKPSDVMSGRRIEIGRDRVLSVTQRINDGAVSVYDVAVAEHKGMQVTLYQFETKVR